MRRDGGQHDALDDPTPFAAGQGIIGVDVVCALVGGEDAKAEILSCLQQTVLGIQQQHTRHT